MYGTDRPSTLINDTRWLLHFGSWSRARSAMPNKSPKDESFMSVSDGKIRSSSGRSAQPGGICTCAISSYAYGNCASFVLLVRLESRFPRSEIRVYDRYPTNVRSLHTLPRRYDTYIWSVKIDYSYRPQNIVKLGEMTWLFKADPCGVGQAYPWPINISDWT